MSIFFALLKSNCLATVRIILGIKTVRSLDTSSHIVWNLQDACNTIGKSTHSKDHNMGHHALSELTVNKSTRQCQLMSFTSIFF